jgi:catechol 2,3-dioxygenase-like lactoylglutathione lyase family enzyme
VNLNHVALPALDIALSSAFYRNLGCEQLVASPHYARFLSPAGEATFSVHLTDPVAPGVVVYFECTDLDAQVAALTARGVRFTDRPADQLWQWREARLTDPAGNLLCLFQAGETRRNPPWRIKPEHLF